MKIAVTKIDSCRPEQVLFDEWLITNGLGGFASGSLSGAPMRKYHSLLIAALPNPYGRTNMLNYVADAVILADKTEIQLTQLRTKDNKDLNESHLKEVRFENGLPTWVYDCKGVIIEKSLLLIHRQNTLHISYKLVTEDADPIQIKWQPYFHFRTNEQSVNSVIPDESYTVHAKDFQYEIECPNYPPLRIYNSSQAPFTLDSQVLDEVFYEIEAQRGYESLGNLKSPGYFLINVQPKNRETIIVSTESWNNIFALTSREAWVTEKLRKKSLLKTSGESKNPIISKLVLAADQFIITPTTRYEDMIRLQALGEESKTVIAGFPWFTDWGRDTMISLEGLTLATGRSREAYSILHTFGHYIRNGLIPNMFPDGENQGIYNTADATLWFFHAIDRYIQITKDEDILEFLLPKLSDIIQNHINGTLFGIKVDTDGLLIQGQKGVQLTWMDAKVGDWVVTPRRGKAVEINALWYNALKLYEKWSGKKQDIAEQCRASFNTKFWFGEGNYLYDVIEGENGNDSALRPNQLFAISLSNPILEQERWKQVLNIVTEHLYTPFGLRTLSPSHPDYKRDYDGDLYARDAAYHQGTVWPWLIGPYIDVMLKVNPDDLESARKALKGLVDYLDSNCMSTIGEIFDADAPYKARGCFAQAWSVAEVLRCLNKVGMQDTSKDN
ncbi:MAG: amylo-alpha-1,6-glucosidase [Parachlamydiales bacterium]|jgi:predicted glycogen debranching enzyme